MGSRWGALGVLLAVITGIVRAQESVTGGSSLCYGAGSIAMAVIFTFFGTLLLVGALFYYLKRRADAKRDNHLILETDPEAGGKAEYAFDNHGFKDATLTATSEKPTETANKPKWARWSPLFTLKPEKKRPLDDSVLKSTEVKVVALNSQDFTGLGFNICGNMKEGIYIRDILHRGPAFESGKLNPGDRINSVTISFEHIVYEDALNILSYASPYEVIIEAKGERTVPGGLPQKASPLVHPMYRSSSAWALVWNQEKSRSNVTTLERKESKSPRPGVHQKGVKKTTPEMHLKVNLQLPIDEVRKRQKSPKILEQNQNNANIEIGKGIDEVDLELTRGGSGIKRDLNGIPLEIPAHMQEAALYARKNRKSAENGQVLNGYDSERRPSKGKAPSPPEVTFTLGKTRGFEDLSALASDSEDERTNSSVNTIELNSSDVIVHQPEDKARKTASTGDLTKMKKPSRSGTLERAQSLDITADPTTLGQMHAFDATENLLIDKEPRLSLILDGLNTLQKSRLKSSAEWGYLEDAILNPCVDDEGWDQRRQSEPHFNAVIDRVIQIKRESQEIDLPEEVMREYQQKQPKNDTKVVVNKLWPDEEDLNQPEKPVVPERTKLKMSEIPQPAERASKAEDASTRTSLLNHQSANVSVEVQCIKPIPPRREKTPEKETTIINLNNKLGPLATTFEKQSITEMCSQMAKGRNGDGMIKDEWEVITTSPPASMTLVDEVMDSYHKNYGNVVTVGETTGNLPDETKTMKNVTEDFLFNERRMSSEEPTLTTNIPDDLKVCQAKMSEGLHSLELSINEPGELYTTALEDNNITNDVMVIVTKPDHITVKKIETGPGEVAITENSFSVVTKKEVPIEVQENKEVRAIEEDGDKFKVEITESKYSTFEVDKSIVKALHLEEPLVDFKGLDDESPAISLTEISPDQNNKTYITEIHVSTPSSNISEVQVGSEDPLENAFEDYVKNFERKVETFESNVQGFEDNLQEFVKEPRFEREKSDVERQVCKIQELAEEQLKTLPEMRFTTSSYESGGRKTPEKRHSFELLRSNFEKASGSPPRKDSLTKSRIPIATTMKTPPMSPERRDSKNLENENEKAILELMNSSAVHSTPFASKIKPPSAKSNVSVTSIRNNSKIPSGLPTLASRPPIPPRKGEDHSSNGGMESSFKQWVFNPGSNVTNVTVGKEK
ncbi:uncharacterized protein [Euwallacea fornicatus]|uniref:uncharacterized protein isoform X1 n=2 Tax=Euwallacea fornicatus TaxID=995702 RepID=UPI00338F97EE